MQLNLGLPFCYLFIFFIWFYSSFSAFFGGNRIFSYFILFSLLVFQYTLCFLFVIALGITICINFHNLFRDNGILLSIKYCHLATVQICLPPNFFVISSFILIVPLYKSYIHLYNFINDNILYIFLIKIIYVYINPNNS